MSRIAEWIRGDDRAGPVACDEYECEAIYDPKTPEEMVAAYEHWRWHSWLNGCSHGD